jgi:hypothetical protein
MPTLNNRAVPPEARCQCGHKAQSHIDVGKELCWCMAQPEGADQLCPCERFSRVEKEVSRVAD